MNTFGIGGSTIEAELNAITPTAHLVEPIQKEEFQARINKACLMMKAQNKQAMYLHAGTNLFYFTGMKWSSSERMVGAILFQNGDLHFIAPKFEKGTVLDFMLIKGDVNCWEEHKSPFKLFTKILIENKVTQGDILMDEATPFFIIDGINKCNEVFTLESATPITAGCRMIKSDAEIAIMQHAMNITLEVQKAAARILRVGISAKEVEDFIHEAHIKYGATAGSYFCIVLFGVDSSFPHGVKTPKNLELNEVVLVDTGCVLHDYISDITRTYVFGEADDLQRSIWNIEKETQQAAFKAAKLGRVCADIDAAARKTLESHQLGPKYDLPGLPHRTGHGIGLDIHEWPYIVKNDNTVLAEGMAFSNEPMICVPNKFGIRHEDHIYMTENGAKWFTEPMHSIEDPFGISK
ncbi:aminopeptidase P family protein [Tenacibaculum finnmarkense genomovar finnmarkense]|uniref:M24 family metallopeptidase n=1 Tax=Tenacibaculum finnmarkense TaxID=2781243 RepID=UPI001E421593|nr:Xaa-Pro peptidase family protein [Tenacibaculum finnmarkense]MCD8416468.1 Xaa-Pro peptidase family protein [Tenacibaculum finnmarkense genomovar finnmarkense]MCG8185330.1 aminopeptidase P family protein [Tenacibaculum finnmarkense genomovar finnmarkense]MCG8201403.1 aminopeptidase P family protein [Tenacibaculum finnmarkense genomovar finnmarkense]MCG8209168.1 aminopeptidase P family protein [Tenacibaculum finnmarkense genomovar finnmarkense]MCG8211963.1 aminopeptidase P family protein [Ten